MCIRSWKNYVSLVDGYVRPMVKNAESNELEQSMGNSPAPEAFVPPLESRDLSLRGNGGDLA